MVIVAAKLLLASVLLFAFPTSSPLKLAVITPAERSAPITYSPPPPPIVIDRYYFKEDGTGYMSSRRQHLYVFDLATRRADIITPGRFSESMPSWSPDGTRIAFYSKRGEDPDRNNEFGLYTIEPRSGATPKLVTEFQGDTGDSSWMSPPVWRPDGREIAFLTAGDPKSS